ncbi:hypothetical protein LCGC14_2748340 [marine sediment metagenome]|uniref:Uncharacterized protein n=1 Tax=marine sediment metagenome TaxID=412755 RepID=A0A0F9BU72_9ZZZZ
MIVGTAAKVQAQLGVRIADVTPEDVKSWLVNNEGNRNLRGGWINKLARDMTAGTYTLSPDCIAFDQHGKLINGQHRLLAIIKSGTTQTMLIVDGLPSNSITNIDTGMLRQFGDMLHFHRGEVNGRTLGAVVSFVYIWHALEGNYRPDTWRAGPTTEEGLAFFDEKAELFREAARWVAMVKGAWCGTSALWRFVRHLSRNRARGCG